MKMNIGLIGRVVTQRGSVAAGIGVASLALALSSCAEKKPNVILLPPPPSRFEVPAQPAVVADNIQAGINACMRGPVQMATTSITPDGEGGVMFNTVANSAIVPPFIELKPRPAGTRINLDFAGATISWELVNRLKAWSAGNIICAGAQQPS